MDKLQGEGKGEERAMTLGKCTQIFVKAYVFRDRLWIAFISYSEWSKTNIFKNASIIYLFLYYCEKLSTYTEVEIMVTWILMYMAPHFQSINILSILCCYLSLSTFGCIFQEITHTAHSAQQFFSVYLWFVCPPTHSASQHGVFWRLHSPPICNGQILWDIRVTGQSRLSKHHLPIISLFFAHENILEPSALNNFVPEIGHKCLYVEE